MPNWCHNEVVVKCSTMQVASDLLQAVTEKHERFDGRAMQSLSFAKILPEPTHDGYMEQGSGPMPEWYGWRVNNWGTKWNVGECDIDLHLDDDHVAVTFAFSTAWSPALPVTVALSKMFPLCMVSHSYDEPGMDFGGYEVYVNGDVVEQQEGGSRMSSWSDLAEWSSEYQWSEQNKQVTAS